MERYDKAGITVTCQLTDPLAHFIGCFIGKCDT